MSDTLSFTTASRRAEPIEFDLDGDRYHFTPPKMARMMLPIVDGDADAAQLGAFRGLMDWLSEGLPDEEEARLEARLRDPDDDLDISEVAEIARALTKRVGGRPTQPRSG